MIESAIIASRGLELVKRGRIKHPYLEGYRGAVLLEALAMQEVFKMIGQVAAGDVSVMITDESGTGKELIARAIYQNSLHVQKPYIAVSVRLYLKT